MHNLRVDQLRRGGVATTSLDDDEAADVPVRPTQSDLLEVMDLESALSQLPDEQREVLLLVALEEMRYADIAALLGVPIGTVMSRLSRGRERLRQVMDGRQPTANLRVVR
jgi:RNA polymerase sigma-70 factor (ECF subfamily)